MAAKRIFVTIFSLTFLQMSFANFDRFWKSNKDNSAIVVENWDTLSEKEQLALIKRYQALKEIPRDQSEVIQQRMDWFTQLPEQDKQKMREVWQQMSSIERNEMRKKLEKATTAQERQQIRENYLQKYMLDTQVQDERTVKK